MADVRETAAGEDLRSLLQPWLTPGLDYAGGFRFHDAPPDQVRRALDSIDATWSTARFNGQPPADWLVSTAERLGGRLAGQVGNDAQLPQRLRVDAIAVPNDRARELAHAVDGDWPQITFGDTALGLALAEAWKAWEAEAAFWTGNGRDLLTAPPDAAAAVIGLWWD